MLGIFGNKGSEFLVATSLCTKIAVNKKPLRISSGTTLDTSCQAIINA